MSDVHCPETKEIRPMTDCIKCEWHIPNGSSLEWCGFKIQEPIRTEIPINALRLQMNQKNNQAEYLYKRGKTKQGYIYSYEAASLHRLIKQRKIKEKKY